MYDLVTEMQVVDAFSNLNGCDRENGIVFHKAHVWVLNHENCWPLSLSVARDKIETDQDVIPPAVRK